jgi:serine/threonine protein kinase/ankyrin repeat protein
MSASKRRQSASSRFSYVDEDSGGGIKISVGKKKQSNYSNKNGFLTKRAMSTPGLNWKKRFFVLSEGSLSYYKPGGSLFNSSQEHMAYLKGEILLDQGTYVRETNVSERANAFEIVTGSKTMICQATSESERGDWMAAIRQHVVLLKPPNSDDSDKHNVVGDSFGIIGEEEITAEGDKTELLRRLLEENQLLKKELQTKFMEVDQLKQLLQDRATERSAREKYPVIDMREIGSKVQRLMEAAKEGDLAVVLSLVAEPLVDINSMTGGDQMTALHFAAQYKHSGVIEILLKWGASTDAFTAADCLSPLHMAAKAGCAESVINLLQYGADPTVRDKHGNSALHCAAEGAFTEVVRLLLEVGARADIANADGSLPENVAPIGHAVRRLLHEANDEAMVEQAVAEDGTRASFEEPSFYNRYQASLPLGPRDFEFCKVLGQGAFAKVYLVRGKGTSRHKWYAMKAYDKKSIVQKKQSRYIMTERKVLTECSDHPFIVTLHFAFVTSDRLFLVMDFCGGGDLLQHLTEHKHFPEPDARFYIAEITLGLEHLHAKGLIFRDLKPENVVIDNDGHLMLTDFGIAKSGVDLEDESSNKTFCGSPMYLAPEMLQRKGHGQALDWYSMGALLFELISGLPPYYSQDRSTLFQNILKGELVMPESASDHAQDFMTRLLERAPERRLGSGIKGAADIKGHKFFGARSAEELMHAARERAATSSDGLEEAMDWAALSRKEITPPHCPCKPSTRPDGMPDLKNFSRNFRDQPISSDEKGLSTPAMRAKSATVEEKLFNGFNFGGTEDAEEEGTGVVSAADKDGAIQVSNIAGDLGATLKDVALDGSPETEEQLKKTAQ